MEGGSTIAPSAMPVVEETERVGDEFERRRADALGFPVNIGMTACPMFRGEGGEPSLQETAVERGVVGDDEHYPPEQIVDGSIINAVTRDHLVGNAGNVRDFWWDREAGIFEPLPGAENFVDPPVLTVVFEEADPDFDDFVAIGVSASRLDIDDGGDELWVVIG
jgi:hypothetical protein